jgi:hypothetical protein
MADQKLSALTEVTAPANSDMLYIVDAATSKKVQIQNAVKAAAAIWARVYHNANQSTTSGTPLLLALNSERFDTDTIHDTVTNNSRLTCKTAGVYAIKGTVRFASNSTGARTLAIKLNGTTYLAYTQTNAVSSGSLATILNIATTYAMAVNDYVELEATQSSGGALNVESIANYSPEFMMTRFGA